MSAAPRWAGALLLSALCLTGCGGPAPQPDPEPDPTHVDPDDDGGHPNPDPDANLPKDRRDPNATPKGSHARTSVAVRGDRSAYKRVIFFNDFGRPHTDKIVAALKQNGDFLADKFMVDSANARRITVECTYRGKNLRLAVSKAADAVGVAHHFKEAELPKHLEVWRTKR